MQVKGVNRVIRNATLLMMKTIVFYTRGKNFVLFFKEIKQLRAVYLYAQVLALSAFLSKDGQKSVAQQLLITQYESIISNPSKETSLVVKGRPAVGKQNLFEKSLWLSVWVCVYELQRKQQDYPLMWNIDRVRYGSELVERIFGYSMYGGDGQFESPNVPLCLWKRKWGV